MAMIKRLEVPGHWQIEKKTKKYTVTTLPGPHSRAGSLTIAILLREILKHAETLREVSEILKTGTVKVNGLTRRKTGFAVGLMDVFTVGDENYRMLPGKRGFYLKAISAKEAEFKLQKITGKTTIAKGRTQLHFHDGTNMLVSEGSYKTGDVAVLDLKTRKIKDIVKQEKGAKVLVIKGNNKGLAGTLENIKIVKSPEPNIATVASAERKITLPTDYIFAIGKNEALISLGEENA